MIVRMACLPVLPALLIPVVLLSLGSDGQAVEPIHAASVPGLAVRDDGRTGVIHYIVIQITTGVQSEGPVIQFSQINLGGGSLVGDDWKESIKQAVAAAIRQLGVDGRDWLVTIKNRSYNSVTDGASNSGAVAVGVMAAWRGDAMRSDVAMTGRITPDGNIVAVGNIPAKLEAAARERFKTVLVPRGQVHQMDWDLSALAAKLHLTVLEVETLEQAYQLMAGESR